MGAEYRDGQWAQARQAVCLTQPPPEPVCSDGEVLISHAAGTDLTALTLLATDLMELRDVTVPGTVASLGLADTVVFSGAEIGNIYSRGLVDLRSGATVTGFIKTTTQIAVQGSANYNPNLVDINHQFEPVETESLCFPEPSGIDQSPNVFVDVNQTVSSPPGTYNDVELRNNATWVLSPGNYWLDWLQVEPGSVFEVDTSGCSSSCAVVLNIRTEIQNALRGSVEPANSNLLILYHGTLPTIINSAFDGFIVAMNAELRINNNEPHSGAFFAKQLYVDAGQTISHRPFPIDAIRAQQP